MLPRCCVHVLCSTCRLYQLIFQGYPITCTLFFKQCIQVVRFNCLLINTCPIYAANSLHTNTKYLFLFCMTLVEAKAEPIIAVSCQAQPSPSSSSAELAVFSLSPTHPPTQPPPTQPPPTQPPPNPGKVRNWNWLQMATK